MKAKEHLHEIMNYYYQMFQLPIFLCSSTLQILLSPRQFTKTDTSFFERFATALQTQQPLYFLLEENLTYIIVPYEEQYIIIGPTLFSKQESIYTIVENSFTKLFETKHSFQLPYLDYKLLAALQLLYLSLFDKTIDFDDIVNVQIKHKHSSAYLSINEKKLTQQKQNNYTYSHHMKEKYLHNVAKGNKKEAFIQATQYLNSIKDSLPTTDIQMHKASLISVLSLMTQALIQEGASIKDAYILQDAYILKLHASYSFNQHYHLFIQATAAYCTLAREVVHHQYPQWIRMTIDYIDEHLYTKITLQDVANKVYLTPAYISVKFKELTGHSFIYFINMKKIEEATYLLSSSSMKITEISESLGFTNTTYFTKVFQKVMCQSPCEYRKMNNSK